MDAPDSTPIAAPLAHRLDRLSDAPQIAHAICTVWQEIDVALRPIVGPRGVVALYCRSVQLTAASYPWLAASVIREPAELFETAALKALLAQQNPAQALACGSALLLTFHELLATLIGASLTERLLRSAWGPH